MRFLNEFATDLRLSRAPATAFAIVGIYWGSFAGLVPDLKAAIGASDGVFGIAMLVSSIGAVAAMWLAPRVDARLGARAMQGCALFLALAFLLPGLASGAVFFSLAMLLAASGSGSIDVIINTRVSGIEAANKRSLMNLNHALFSFAYAGAAVCAGLFREAGFSPAFVFAVACAITLVLLPFMHHQPAREEDSTVVDGKTAKRALVLLGGAIILIAFLAEQATEAWSALHLERGLGASAAQGALGPAILGLTMGIGRLSGQFISAHVRETRVLQGAALIAATGIAIAGAANSLSVGYAGFTIFGLGVSVLAPMAYSAVGKRTSSQTRAVAITRISVIGYLGFFVGPPMMGLISESFGLKASFFAVAALLLVISAVLAPLMRKQ
ncbi:MFS transporter [Planktotalea sp.]|uniref:MFS transporter n=1 Tax=Planktotalea sp. TaxID=2029877 RepID=UPI003D6A3C5E